MLRSMTGFGKGFCRQDGREIVIELRSVNHKFLDLSFRMPRTLGFLEDTLRCAISESLSRGHVDVSVTYRNTRDDAKSVTVDKSVLVRYMNAGNELADEYGLRNDLAVLNLMRLPEVVTVTENEDDADAVCAIARTAVDMALSELVSMREREGAKLCDDMNKKLDNLSDIRDVLESRAETAMLEHKAKLEERIAALMPQGVEVDASRLATEVACMADKASVDEEMVRIKTHIANMREMLTKSEPMGRKLDFMVQELNREFNTTGSKSTDVTIAENVIAGKAEIEKLREQIQNIE
ncbi:MAG: YicC family protein [Clostridia bacterium]|nr:YicC family protein [Clostridia bacterium]